MKRLLTLFLATSFLMVSMSGCAESTPEQEPKSEAPVDIVEYISSSVEANVFEINGIKRDIGDYLETEELFLMELEENGLTNYELYDASELSLETLENRNGKTIIERCIGVVTNGNTGVGEMLNFDSKYGGYYISYSCILDEVRTGTVVLSYMIYDPSTNFSDDIMERHDFVICREYED